jgi:hypothetical protein
MRGPSIAIISQVPASGAQKRRIVRGVSGSVDMAMNTVC